MVNFVRVYSGDDGQSHMEEFVPEFNPFVDTEGAHGEGTALEPATGITIRRNPPGYFLDFHCAPRRQYTITVAGELELGVGDGTVRRFKAPTVLLAEDLTGQGHTTRVVGTEMRVTIVVPLAD